MNKIYIGYYFKYSFSYTKILYMYAEKDDFKSGLQNTLDLTRNMKIFPHQ